MSIPLQITKRDGRTVTFDQSRITQAIYRCLLSIDRSAGEETEKVSEKYAIQVVNIISAKFGVPNVEQVQDAVEAVLNANGEFLAARHYILYREEKSAKRRKKPIPESIRSAFAESDSYFSTPLQKFQFYDKYSRFDYKLKRRETWIETVTRSVNFLKDLSKNKLDQSVYDRIYNSILTMKVMPSMRLLAMAGPAAKRNNLCIYNCSYLDVSSIDSFVEALIISMCGCGVGYSVESGYVEQLDRVKRQSGHIIHHVVEDTSEGWAEALRLGLTLWFSGEDVTYDFSQIRPAGSPLKIKGGRASGSESLCQMLGFIRGRILSRQGSYLRPLDAHDIMCAIGNASISGGVRRTALISLIDFDDVEMRNCKAGDFERANSQRWNANNSVVLPDRELSQAEILQFILDMNKTGRGEPGIFSRRAALLTKPERRKVSEFGSNPCGEIVLPPCSLCNLSSVVSRSDDTLESLLKKVEVATIVGTIQSMATNFPGLREKWKTNCEEERLLGVDLNGQMDCTLLKSADVLESLKKKALETNRQYASILDINQSVALTCVKPSGNSSLLLDCSSGIHARWSPYYIRNVRINVHSPVYKVMKDAGVPMDPENGQVPETATTWVLHFPVKSPDSMPTRKDRSALEQCEYWMLNKLNWTEHNPSCTISYYPDELLDICKWIYENQSILGGITFLPADDAQYDQMPYMEITKEEYAKLYAAFPPIDFSKLYYYEDKDLTNAAQELACMAGQCEI